MSESVRPATDEVVAKLKAAVMEYERSPEKTPLDNLVWGMSSCIARIDADRAIRDELLAALEELLVVHDAILEAFPEKTEPPAITKARAAIAKAAQGREESK